jgi:tetratricopeptide (TPR) repeat protein
MSAWQALCMSLLVLAGAKGQGAATQAAVARADETLAPTLKEARTLIDGGQARAAVQKLEPLKADGDPRVTQLLGVAHYHADEYQPAVDLLLSVRDRLPADSIERRETEQVLGFALHLLGRHADAIPWLERTRVHSPDHLELNFVLAQAYVQTRQPGPAREAFARTFGVPPDSAAAYVLAAKQMIRVQMEPMGEEALQAAIKLDPKVPQANYLLGQLALFRGRLDEAIAASARELAINPTDAMALYQMGDAYTRQGKWDDAVRVLQQSLWLNPYYSGPYILLGRAYMKKAQPATAEGMLRRAIEYDPNNRTAHYLLAQLLQQTGRPEDAAREFAIAEKLQGQQGRP